MIVQYKHILIIGIEETDALAWQEKLFLPLFFRINVIPSTMKNMDARKNLFFLHDKAP